MTRLDRWMVGGLVSVALACAGTEPPGPPSQLLKSGGDEQRWYFSNPLPVPYSVTALDAGDRPVAGVAVAWAVASGGGTVDPATSTTDASGLATATHTLGPSDSLQLVTATAENLPPVTFTAAVAAPPTSGAVQVGDDFFSPANIAVRVNSTVTWTWSGANPHSVTFTGGTPSSATQASGPPYSRTFSGTGTFDYFCKVHAGMKGVVTVVQ